jgi:hypothetical protein
MIKSQFSPNVDGKILTFHGFPSPGFRSHQELEDELDTIDAFVALGGEPDKPHGLRGTQNYSHLEILC